MDIHYKEKDPKNTVAFLKNKLKTMNLQTEEACFNASVIGTNSVRVVFKGTRIGTNGKGVNKDYCMASAYAELFERFSNNFVNPVPDFRDNSSYSFRKFPDEQYLNAFDIVKQDNAYINRYFENRNKEKLSIEEKSILFESVNVPDKIENNEKYYLTVPFFDVRNKKTTYLPYSLFIHNFGSNGMSAGNSPAEAIVQGLAEIVERFIQKKIIVEALQLPNVPDDVIKKYPYVYSMFKRACSFENLNVYMKDCSLGGEYPVAGLLMIEKNTGKYGLKLGCHPDFGVAMERTLTEATQGGEITIYSNRSYMDFTNKSVYTPHNLMNSFATGKAQYPFQSVSQSANAQFKPVKNVEGMTNEQIAKLWINELLQKGYDIFIRDNSWLDFPAFHIIIPNMSEVQELTDIDIKAGNTRAYLSELLRHPDNIGNEECGYISSFLDYTKGNVLTDNIKSILPLEKQVIFNSNIASTRYLSIMCDLKRKDYKKAHDKMYVIEKSFNKLDLSEKEKRRIFAERFYLSAFLQTKNHETALSYLRSFFDKEIVAIVDKIYRNTDDVFVNILPEIRQFDIDEEINLNSNVYAVQDSLMCEMEKKCIDQNALDNIVSFP